MLRTSLVALIAGPCILMGCASSDLAAYPSGHWPRMIVGAPCTQVTGSYADVTEEIWPTPLSRGNKGRVRRSLGRVLAEVSPVARPENLATLERVDIQVEENRAKLIGAVADVASLDGWKCAADGALVAMIDRASEGEGSIDARVELRFELRRAADQSLILNQVEQFSDSSVKGLTRETWYRFRPVSTS